MCIFPSFSAFLPFKIDRKNVLDINEDRLEHIFCELFKHRQIGSFTPQKKTATHEKSFRKTRRRWNQNHMLYRSEEHKKNYIIKQRKCVHDDLSKTSDPFMTFSLRGKQKFITQRVFSLVFCFPHVSTCVSHAFLWIIKILNKNIAQHKMRWIFFLLLFGSCRRRILGKREGEIWL